MSASQDPCSLLLRRHRCARARLITSHYSDYLHGWLIIHGERAFAPFSNSMSWEQFRSTVAPYLCSRRMPAGTMRMPLPCRKVGQDHLRWKNVSFEEARVGGFYWRKKRMMGQWTEKEAITWLGVATNWSVSVDPVIGGMGRGVGHRDLVGKEVAWNEGVEDESMWNESEEEGGDKETTGGDRWSLHEPKETREQMRRRLAMEEDEDAEMKTDDEQEAVEEGDGEQGQAEETPGLDSEWEIRA